MLKLAVPLLLTAASAAVSVAGTMEANKQQAAMVQYQNQQKKLAFERSLAYNRAVNEIKAQDQKQALAMRYDAMKGASVAQGAERNVIESRSQSQLMNALGYMASRESAKISMERNLADLGYEINAQPQYGVAGSSSPWLAGVAGGLSGLNMGINVSSAMQQYNASQTMLGYQRAIQGLNSPAPGSPSPEGFAPPPY